MKLIWTYNNNVKFDTIVGEHTSERKIILLNYYIHSINLANKFGYYTVMYCNKELKPYFENIVNEIIITESYENSVLWDSFKIKVLEERTDDFILIDGDVILHNQLPKESTDIIFDSYEMNLAYKYKYKNILKYLTEMGIGDVIDVWVNKELPIISCGVLSIKNDVLKNKYVHYWKIYNEFINQNNIKVNIDLATMVGAQYLLSILSENYSHTNLSQLVGGNNPYYKHHCGPIKYNNPIVSDRCIINTLKKELI